MVEDAYSSAMGLTVSQYICPSHLPTSSQLQGVTSITNDKSLRAALLQYLPSTEFKEKFNCIYGETPVDFPSGETQGFLSSWECIDYFTSRDISDVGLKTYVKAHIMK